MNINPSDGNNYGYGASYWTGDTSYGTPAESLAKDFQDKDVRNMPANYIAIVRHNNGVCEGARVWRFTVGGNSLRHHFKTATRSIETEGGIVSEDIPTSTNRDSDPILSSVGGNLAFNWWHSNNAARIALDGVGKGDAMNSKTLSSQTVNDDDTHGLGNEFGGSPSNENMSGSSAWWHDASAIQGDCHGGTCVTLGTDHGSSLSTTTMYGQYAIYVTTTAQKFPCSGATLQTRVTGTVLAYVYNKTNNVVCGYYGSCIKEGVSGSVSWGGGQKGYYSPKGASVDECKVKCSAHADCAGFNYDKSMSTCYYRSVANGGTSCGGKVSRGRDCYEKQAPTSTPTPPPAPDGPPTDGPPAPPAPDAPIVDGGDPEDGPPAPPAPDAPIVDGGDPEDGPPAPPAPDAPIVDDGPPESSGQDGSIVDDGPLED